MSVLWQCVPCIPAWCFWPAAKYAYWSIILQWGFVDLDLILVFIDFNLFQKQTKKKVYIQLPTKESHVINFNINMREDKKKIDFLCSWLYNMFADGLASHLKDQLTKQVKNSINYINL